MTSLIDVIFLLLLFFMLSSTFTRFAELEITAAAGSAGAEAGAPPLFLQLGAGSLSLNGDEVALDALPDALRDRAGDQSRTLLVSLGDGVTAQRLTDILVAVRPVSAITPTIIGAS